MSPDLTVFCPSRGRPENAIRLHNQFYRTSTADSKLIFIIDEDDPVLTSYLNIEGFINPPSTATMYKAYKLPIQRGMTRALNNAFHYFNTFNMLGLAVGFMGDDHFPQTVGWDQRYLDAINDLGGTGFVYGNDLLQREKLPTQVAFSSNIALELGQMVPEELYHLYVDNYWKALGEGIQRIQYLGDVIIEHLHPLADKAAEDEGYRVVNSPDVADHDKRAWQKYRRRQLRLDIEKVKELL